METTNGKIIIPDTASVVIEEKPVTPPPMQILGNRLLVDLRRDLEIIDPGVVKRVEVKGVKCLEIRGFVVPEDKMNNSMNNAIIVARGDGDKISPKLEVGKRIFVGQHHGWRFVIQNKTFNVIAADDVIGIIDL